MIALASDRHLKRGHHLDRNGSAFEIYVMRADGRDVRRITHNHVADLDPDWRRCREPGGRRDATQRGRPTQPMLNWETSWFRPSSAQMLNAPRLANGAAERRFRGWGASRRRAGGRVSSRPGVSRDETRHRNAIPRTTRIRMARRVLGVELAGLEPATSWVRSKALTA